MAAGKLSCPDCDRTFSMAAHLARHQAAMHGGKKPGAAKKGKQRATRTGVSKSAPARNVARRRNTTSVSRPVGRPTGAIARLGLKNMSLEQLGELVEAARAEARRKIADLQNTID